MGHISVPRRGYIRIYFQSRFSSSHLACKKLLILFHCNLNSGRWVGWFSRQRHGWWSIILFLFFVSGSVFDVVSFGQVVSGSGFIIFPFVVFIFSQSVCFGLIVCGVGNGVESIQIES